MYRLTLILGLALLLAACAPAAQVPAPTPARTATPAPTTPPQPTATPTQAPTVTPAPTTSAATPAAAVDLLSGVQNASAARSYRAEVSMSGNGTAGAVSLGSPQAPAEVMGMEGAFSGADYRFTLTGFVTALYGGSSATGIQVVHVAGQDYIHGPLAVIGAFRDAWYRLPPTRAALATPPLYPAGLLALVAQSGVSPTGFSPAGQEQLDRQRCQRFRGDRAASLAILKSLGDSGLPVDTVSEHIDRVAADLWVCADGYLHQVRLAFAGATPAQKPQPFDFTISMRMYDFAADVGVAAPDTALDIAAPPSP
ncbi:MAG: hypothetical protein WCI67_14105 [Chloroflexales bacterium]